MRYLCLNQAVSRNAIQSPTMAEKRNKRQLEKTTDDNALHDGLVPTKKAKRFRSAFTTEQIQYLDLEFKKYPYIGSARRKEVANVLNITERAVKIWFQNRRMKEKKDGATNEVEGDEHKNSRKIDAANDQLNNECTVTSTNNQHYASITIPLMPIKSVSPIDSVKKEDALVEDKTNQKVSPTKSSAEFSIELFKQYSNYITKPKCQGNPASQNEIEHSEATKLTPKNEVSSTSPYEKLPQDLSRKQNQPQVRTMAAPQNPTGGYFPLNLKKYYAQPLMSVGSSMLWKPVQVMPVPNGQMAPMNIPPMTAQDGQECRCDCRCHPRPPMLVQQGAPNAMPQYVLTALPLQNPYYEY